MLLHSTLVFRLTSLLGIRAIPNLPAPPANPVENGINSAILRYVTADVAEPLDDSIDIRNPLDENALVVCANSRSQSNDIHIPHSLSRILELYVMTSFPPKTCSLNIILAYRNHLPRQSPVRF